MISRKRISPADVGLALLSAGRFVADAVLSVFFPSACALCGEPVESWADGITCARCWETSSCSMPSARCSRCQAPTFAREAVTRCPACREMVLDRLRFVGAYAGALRSHLLFAKEKPYICRRLRQQIGEAVREEASFQDVELVIPVPLHPRRLRERGYNQAELVAEEVARALGRPMETAILRRVRYTEPLRAGLDALARARQIAESFLLVAPERVEGRVVLLVDDVYTTGATMNECARAVKRAGARAVYGFAVARALSP